MVILVELEWILDLNNFIFLFRIRIGKGLGFLRLFCYYMEFKSEGIVEKSRVDRYREIELWYEWSF